MDLFISLKVLHCRFVLVQPITFNTDSVALKIYFYNRDVSESIVDTW